MYQTWHMWTIGIPGTICPGILLQVGFLDLNDLKSGPNDIKINLFFNLPCLLIHSQMKVDNPQNGIVLQIILIFSTFSF